MSWPSSANTGPNFHFAIHFREQPSVSSSIKDYGRRSDGIIYMPALEGLPLWQLYIGNIARSETRNGCSQIECINAFLCYQSAGIAKSSVQLAQVNASCWCRKTVGKSLLFSRYQSCSCLPLLAGQVCRLGLLNRVGRLFIVIVFVAAVATGVWHGKNLRSPMIHYSKNGVLRALSLRIQPCAWLWGSCVAHGSYQRAN